MGLVLDSSVLIVAEREARAVSSLLAALKQQHYTTLDLPVLVVQAIRDGSQNGRF